MKFRVVLAGLAGVALAATSQVASAACSMSKFRIPVAMEGLRPMVTGKVNGQDVRFLLDSGAFFSGVSAKFAVEQKMRPAGALPDIGSHLSRSAETRFTGVGGGERASAVVQADEFRFANANLGRAMFMTLPIDEGGILGQNLLRLTDDEYDFKNGEVFMATVQDCKAANLAYWTKGPYAVLPLIPDASYHTVATVLINGIKMKAIFDTGADVTFITRRAAARAGVKPTDADVKESGFTEGLDGIPIKSWTARFASVKLDTEEIANGTLEIGDTQESDFDMLIGADFFLAHHVYVANSQGKIYFTHDGSLVFAAGSRNAGATAASAKGGSDKAN